MSLEKLIKEFNKDNTKALEKIEKIVEPDIKAINRASKYMRKIDPKAYNNLVNFHKELSGHVSSLRNWYRSLEALVRSKEAAYFCMLKQQANEEGTKFVSAPAEKESSLAVAKERKLRNKILGRLEAGEGLIYSCRSMLSTAKAMGELKED